MLTEVQLRQVIAALWQDLRRTRDLYRQARRTPPPPAHTWDEDSHLLSITIASLESRLLQAYIILGIDPTEAELAILEEREPQ